MARHDIRGLKLSDGTYSLTSKDVYNLNDNFIQLSQEVFGNSDFSRKVEKRVTEAEEDIVELESSVDGITISINTTTHSFTADGYVLKDNNGEALMTPNGVANEQNIGRVDNVESGFPMKIPFNIGTEVSQIKQAKLKWDISKFRTYSKGAASGGGSTSGPSSRSTAENSGPEAFVSNTQTELSYPNEGNHYHRITAEQMAHSHGMAHTHTTPNHAHDPVYGILEPNIVDYVFTVYVDGVLRATMNAQRGEVDLSAWITTSGWHEIRLQVNNLMRIDANLFLKTYIRR